MSSGPFEIASTIQAASIKRHPSPSHDLNPPTAASAQIPVHPSSPSHSQPLSPSAIPLRPQRRRPTLPPLPDLRFEQSYLASIPTDASWGRVTYITTRDQVLLPLVQGTLWTLALAGWRHWNRGANMVGAGVGARLRRWWFEVNKWEIPKEASGEGHAKAQHVQEVGR